MQYKRGHVINVGSSVWGLGFAPKNPLEESQITTQYLAVAGYKGAEEESHHFSEVQPRGSYKNCIQLWRLELTVQGEQAVDPVLDVCILHDFGIVRDLKWCPYGAYEEVSRDVILFCHSPRPHGVESKVYDLRHTMAP